MGELKKSVFRGWAQFSVQEFRKFTRATAAVGEVNPFHAEIIRDNFPTDEALRILAYSMCLAANELSFLDSPTYDQS